MRLQLMAALVVASASPAAAQESALRTRHTLYQDDDATTVLTSAVEAEAVVADRVGLRAGYLLDAVSSASVDVVSAATTRWTERRDEIRSGADLYAGDVALSATYVRSLENDYDSHRIAAGASIGLTGRATELAAGFGLTLSDVGRADDPAFHAEQRVYSAELRLVQAIDARTILAGGYSFSLVDGYQASPYRYVRTAGGLAVPERHPDARLRHAITVRLRRSLSERVAAGVDERLYADDWGVLGTTTVLTLSTELSNAAELEMRGRFHFQTGASFYDGSYDVQRRFMSADREISTFLDVYGGPALIVTSGQSGPFRRIRFDVRADLFYYRFLDYPLLRGRIGTLVSLGLEAAL